MRKTSKKYDLESYSHFPLFITLYWVWWWEKTCVQKWPIHQTQNTWLHIKRKKLETSFSSNVSKKKKKKKSMKFRNLKLFGEKLNLYFIEIGKFGQISNYDVSVMSYRKRLNFWYAWKDETHSYYNISIWYLGVYFFKFIGDCNTPLVRRVTKNSLVRRGLRQHNGYSKYWYQWKEGTHRLWDKAIHW